MSELTELRAADAYCAFLARRHYENFSVTSHFLPRETRVHLQRLYAFCRTTDDLGDESGPHAAHRLASWRAQVEECLNGDAMPVHPVLLALLETVHARDLPAQPFLDLIAANEHDQVVSSYEDWEALRGYCLLSAAPVGRLVLRIWCVATPQADALSDDVCIGLQLANFAQDVSRDAVKGRTYLLQRDLRAGGTQVAVAALCDRAETLLDSGRTLEGMVPGRLAAQLALYRFGGLAIVEAIRRADCRTQMVRPTVSALNKLDIARRAAASLQRRAPLVVVPSHLETGAGG
jgi:squalene synthase HpnC